MSGAVAKGRSSLANATKTLKIGDRAPDFELKSHAGETWSLAAHRGKHNVVIAFYPFAFSGTCSSQMPAVEQDLDRFEAHGARVVGVSIDSTYANGAWAQALGGISYPLLSDFYPHGRVAELYGVLRAEGMAERAIFIVDRSGIIRYIDVHTISEQPDEDQIFDELRKLA